MQILRIDTFVSEPENPPSILLNSYRLRDSRFCRKWSATSAFGIERPGLRPTH